MTNINWNGDAESAPFKSRFDDESENLILAETDTGTALFEWDGSAWQFRGPVEMNGEDVSGIESLTATSGNFDSVNTGSLSTNLESGSDLSSDRSYGTTYQNTEDHDMLVYVRSANLSAGESTEQFFQVGPTSALNDPQDTVERPLADGDTAIDRVARSMIVPEGHYYRVIDSGDLGDEDITQWTERGLTV